MFDSVTLETEFDSRVRLKKFNTASNDLSMSQWHKSPPKFPQMNGQASKEIEQRRYNLERDLVAARADVDRTISEVAKLKNDLEQEKQITKMERVRNQRLEELLAEHRRATLELEMSRVDKSALDATLGQVFILHRHFMD